MQVTFVAQKPDRRMCSTDRSWPTYFFICVHGYSSSGTICTEEHEHFRGSARYQYISLQLSEVATEALTSPS